MEQKESEITSQPNIARETVPGLTACGRNGEGLLGARYSRPAERGDADLPEPIVLLESFTAPSATRLIFCAVSFSLSGKELGENSTVGDVWEKFFVLMCTAVLDAIKLVS